MKFKFLKAAAAGFILSASCLVNVANAGLISDTDNKSFIDETTGLEWMDFGINNNLTFNDVLLELEIGGLYDGWELASEQQVLTLWNNIYFSQVDGVNSGQFSAYAENSALWESYNDIIGHNSYWLDVTGEFFRTNEGFFVGDNGNIKKASYSEITDINSVRGYANLYDNAPYVLPPLCFDPSCGAYPNGYGQQNISRANDENEGYSTLLVKTTEVPEPSTLAVFALGMIGLASRRFKKH
jgi:hypothetical protein